MWASELVDDKGAIITHINDGSNAVYQYNPQGVLQLIGWDKSQKGVDVEPSSVPWPMFAAVIDGGRAGNKFNADGYFAWVAALSYSIENTARASTLGNGFRIYTGGPKGGMFYGNQFGKTLGMAKAAKVAGIVGAVAGMGYDLYKYKTNQISGGKFTADGIATVVGFTPAAPLSLYYFRVDAYYPGGVEKYNQDWGNQLYQMQQENPGWRSQQMFP